MALVLVGCGGSTTGGETLATPTAEPTPTTEPAPTSLTQESSEDEPAPERPRDAVQVPFNFQVYRIVEESPADYQRRRDALLSGANPGEESPLFISRDVEAITTHDASECTFQLAADAQARLGHWHRAASEQFAVGLVAFWGTSRNELQIDGAHLRGPCPQGPPSRRLGTTGVLVDIPASFRLHAGGGCFRFENDQGQEGAIIYPADAAHVEALRNEESAEVRDLPLRRGVLAIQRTADGQVTRFVVLEDGDQFWVCTSTEASRYCDTLRREAR